jgi:hypothetical protein
LGTILRNGTIGPESHRVSPLEQVVGNIARSAPYIAGSVTATAGNDHVGERAEPDSQGATHMTSVMTFPLAPQTQRGAARTATATTATPLWQVSRVTALFVLILGCLFLFFDLRRLWHTDLWGELAYGRTIVLSNSLPPTEPLLRLAAGVPLVDNGWLTQCLGYMAIKRWGFTSLQFFHALLVTAMSGLLVYRAYQRSRSLDLALSGLVLFVWGCWYPLGIIRSQLLGLLCFIVLLTMVTARQRRAWQWCAIPLLFAAWVNLDGSFPAGLLLLAGLSVGRVIDVTRRCGQLRAVFRDSQVRRWVLMTQLAAAATLLNPYGLRIYAATWSLANPPTATGLLEWEPLSLRNMMGQVAALIALQLMVLYRFSPRRVASAEVLLLFGFGGAALWSSRLLVWWVPLAAYYFVLHASAVMHPWLRARGKLWRPSPRSGYWTAVAVGVICCCVAVTPFGRRLMLGKNSTPKMSGMVSVQTPMGVVQHLHNLAEQQRLPSGVVFHPHEWGDYLLWSGPQPMQVFANSQPFSLPREVWSDYLTMINGHLEWDTLLDRYGVNLIVLDDERHHLLIHQLGQSETWQRTYADSVGTVFVRRQPI